MKNKQNTIHVYPNLQADDKKQRPWKASEV